MKKTMGYVATAILLGFVVMMMPLALETGPAGFSNFGWRGEAQGVTGGKDNYFSQPLGISSQPSNILPSSLVFFSGLIVALGVYVILKKWVT